MIWTKSITNNYKRYVMLLLFATALSVFLVLLTSNDTAEAGSTPCLGTHAPPYSAGEMNNCVPSAIRNTIINNDANTRQRLIDNNTSTDCSGLTGFNYRRCRINFTSPYRYPSWLSIRNQPTNVNIVVAPNTPINLSLQINQIKFLASSLTRSPYPNPIDGSNPATGSYGSDRVGDITWMGGNFPNDRPPILNEPVLNHAAHRSRRVTFTGASVTSGGGSVSYPNSQISLSQYRSNSRYWFAEPVDLNYSRAGITTTTTVTVNARYKSITQSGSIFHCENSNPTIFKSSLNDSVSNCPERSMNLNFTVIVNNPPTVNITSSNCTTLTYTVSDSDGDRHDAKLQIRRGGSWVDAGPSRSNRPNETNTFNLSSWRDFGSNRFRVVVTDRSTGGQTVASGEVTVGPCATATCSALTLDPENPEPGVPFSATFRVGVDNGIGTNGRDASFTATITFNQAVSGAPQSRDGTIGSGTSSQVVTFTNLEIDSAGEYTGNILVTGLRPNPLDCPFPGGSLPPITVLSKPYFRVYGGNVMAGSNFKDSNGDCDPEVNMSILGWNRGPGPGNEHGGGAGVQLAAFALGQIDQFVSAAGRTSAPTPLKGLTFANSGSGVPGSAYGGGWGETYITCSPDYFANADSATFTLPAGNIGNIGGLDGSYKVSGDLTIENTSNIGKGDRVTIYVEGDVLLNNIVFYNPGNNTQIDDISSVYIVARNIFIAPGVKQIDATLIAQPDSSGSGGTIYTCSNGFNPPTAGQLNGACSQPLVVNGALVAKTVRLLRSNGTVNNGLNNEQTPIIREPGEYDAWVNPDLGAEYIIYSPETWLVNPPGFPAPGARFDAYTAMPPIL